MHITFLCFYACCSFLPVQLKWSKTTSNSLARAWWIGLEVLKHSSHVKEGRKHAVLCNQSNMLHWCRIRVQFVSWLNIRNSVVFTWLRKLIWKNAKVFNGSNSSLQLWGWIVVKYISFDALLQHNCIGLVNASYSKVLLEALRNKTLKKRRRRSGWVTCEMISQKKQNSILSAGWWGQRKHSCNYQILVALM